MLDQSISMVLPKVVGYRLTGEIDPLATSTDVVLTITKVKQLLASISTYTHPLGQHTLLHEWIILSRHCIVGLGTQSCVYSHTRTDYNYHVVFLLFHVTKLHVRNFPKNTSPNNN